MTDDDLFFHETTVDEDDEPTRPCRPEELKARSLQERLKESLQRLMTRLEKD